MSSRKRGKARKNAQNRLPKQSITSAMALPQREHQPPQEEIKAPEPESGPVTTEEKPQGAEGEAAAPGDSKDSKDTKEKTLGLYDDYSLNTIQNLEHVWQSKTGSAGVSTEVCTNHIRVTSQLRKLAYTYHVYYHPKIEGAAAQMILLNQQKSKIGKYFLLDGSSLVVFQKLDNRNMNLISRNDDGSTVEITLAFNTEVLPTSVDYIRYHNIIMRRVLKLMNFEQIGRNYFDHNHGYVFQEHGMEIWPGYSTSVLPYENGLTLCVDACHKVVRFETAYDVICRLHHSLPPDRVRNKVEEELVGCVVITRFNNRTYRINEISWDENPRHKFMKSDGSFISFAEHCKERYKQTITDFEQPMLVSFGKWKKGKEKTQCERIKLIPQLCTLTGIAERVRRNHVVMQNLSAYTRLSPQTRWNKVRNFISDLTRYRCVQEEFKMWDMKFDDNLLKVPARILEDTKIFRGKAWCEAKKKHAEWSKSVTLLSAKKIKKWAIVYAASHESLANYLSARLINVASQMGMTVEIPQMENVNERDTYQSKVKSLGKTAQIVLCLLPNEEKARYDSIKKLLCEEIPILSQCVVARTVDKAQTTPPIISKIVQQMNCKLGGALWKVDIDLKKTMFIGIDCFHDVAHKDQSVAGFVASSNEELTQVEATAHLEMSLNILDSSLHIKDCVVIPTFNDIGGRRVWYSHTIEQSTAQEVVFALEGCLQEAIEQWKKNVSSEPKNIIVYRDGVGDGQLKNLQTTEILKLESYLDAKFPFKIGLTFIVVKKRINTRFFAQSREYVNPTPGTVIDTELTRLQWYDFYIVSQSVREGTVTPTHYNVIHDTVRLQPDVVQRLTYQLCHMYYNVTDMIRVPAPCHYAHRLAYLVGRSLKKEPSKKLSECLYYL